MDRTKIIYQTDNNLITFKSPLLIDGVLNKFNDKKKLLPVLLNDIFFIKYENNNTDNKYYSLIFIDENKSMIYIYNKYDDYKETEKHIKLNEIVTINYKSYTCYDNYYTC